MMVKVSDLQPGMLVDLEGDRYADPLKAMDMLQYELCEVSSIEEETADCTLVHFENWDSCGFPPEHKVKVET